MPAKKKPAPVPAPVATKPAPVKAAAKPAALPPPPPPAPVKVEAKPAPRKAPAKKPAPRTFTPEQRYQWIQEAAYFLAEKQGFSGDSCVHWAEAERRFAAEFG
jgi:hypothetical protein